MTRPGPVPSYPVLELYGLPEELELALAYLTEWACLGTEERDSGDGVRAFFQESTDLGPIEAGLKERHPGISCRAAAPEPLRDWLEEWKKSFRGFALGESFFVLPTWKTTPAISRSILSIDPEQAFGTGTHDTTRLAAMLLERSLTSPTGPRPTSVLDLGSGTGILAMIAARLGASPVRAIEPDPEAVRCAEENLARNGLSRNVRVECGAVEDFPTLRADLVVANILRPVLLEALRRIDASTIILSGLLVEEVLELRAVVPSNFRVETWTSGEWAALLLEERPSSSPSSPSS